jgi:hypothetical protein
MRLTFEMTRGTRTIYFPLEKSPDFPADITVMVRPQCEHGFAGEDAFSAGIAFCNPDDQFSKRRGRVIAYHRMRINGPPGVHGTAQDIVDAIRDKMSAINIRRAGVEDMHVINYYVPDMDEGAIAGDLEKVLSYDALSEYFTKKNEHRVEQQTLEA